MPKAKDKTYKADKAKTTNELYCLCRQPKSEKMTAQCDFCESWFHPACVDLNDDEVQHLSSFKCPGCIDAMSNNPLLSRNGKTLFSDLS